MVCEIVAIGVYFVWWPHYVGGGAGWPGPMWLTIVLSFALVLACSIAAQAFVGPGRPAATEDAVVPAFALLLLPPAVAAWGTLLMRELL